MKIIVLSHRHRVSKAGSYLLDALCAAWTRQGHLVGNVCSLDRPLPEADVAIQHVDMTVVPEEYREACRHFGVVVNGGVNDISKSVFSGCMIGQTDSHDGPVIIKTRENFGGLIERRVRKLEGEVQPPMSGKVNWREARSLRKYPILKSMKEVPPEVWENENLIVEKFLPETDRDGHYNLRIWVFLGDREVHYRCISKSPLVKSDNTLRREDLAVDDVPDELRDVRRRLGIDFGKLDYAVNHGRPVLYDVNKTPSVPTHSSADASIARKLDHLSEGIVHFTRAQGRG